MRIYIPDRNWLLIDHNLDLINNFRDKLIETNRSLKKAELNLLKQTALERDNKDEKQQQPNRAKIPIY